MADIQSKFKEQMDQIATLTKMLSRKQYEAARKKATKLSLEHPENSMIWNLLGASHDALGEVNMALIAFKKAVALNPTSAIALTNNGIVCSKKGLLSDAEVLFEQAIEAKSDYVAPYRYLYKMKRAKKNSVHFAAIKNLIKESGLSKKEQGELHFLLGKMYGDVSNFSESFEHYVLAGKSRREAINYSFTKDAALFKKTRQTASTILGYQRKYFSKSKNITPIFIIGMPRSGTTLVHQMLSNHTKVHGAGELILLDKYCSSMTFGRTQPSPKLVTQCRLNYLDDLGKINNGKHFIVDKNPLNFFRVASIVSCFPEAKIIHVFRDPAATCWSNFTQYFNSPGLGYSNDLDDIAHYYSSYRELMKFWGQVCPMRIYQLDYEKLVANPQTLVEKMLNHLGLLWENNCLEPESSDRPVSTASVTQIKKPIYSGSSKKWKKYRTFIGNAFEKLPTTSFDDF